MTWRPKLILRLLILPAAFLPWLPVLLALRRRPGELYLRRYENPRREMLFLSAISFLIAFSASLGVAYAVYRKVIGFRGVFVGTTRVYHLIFGILTLSPF